MKKTFLIDKCRLYSEVDYSAVLSTKKYNGISVNVVCLEEIEVTSGAVSLFDAYDAACKTTPFLKNFPVGKYTPFAIMVDTSQGKRVAACGIVKSDLKIASAAHKKSAALPTEWKTALREERDVIKLSLSGGGVDTFSGSGVFCLGDFVAAREYIHEVKSHEAAFHPLDALVRLDGETAVTYPFKSGLAVFSTGWGEGSYPSFIGFNGENPSAFICDFLMFDFPYNKTKTGDKVEYVFDIAIEELYQDDPNLTDNENAVRKWSLVIGFHGEIDEAALFNAYSRRGFAYHRLGKLDSALSDYLKAVEISECKDGVKPRNLHNWTLYDNIGNIYRTRGETEKAIEVFKKAKAYPDSFYSGAFISLIDIYLSQKNLIEAISTATEMIETRPLDPNGYIKRSEAYVAAMDYESAIKDLNVLIEKFDQYEFIIDKATYLSKLNRISEALTLLETFLDYSKPTDQYFYTKGMLCYAKKDLDSAISSLQNSLKENPDYIPSIVLLIEIEDLCFNYEAIISLADRYVELRPSSEYGRAMRASAYYALKKYQLATENYLAISAVSKEPKIIRRLILCLIKQKNYAGAKKYIKYIKKLDESYFLNATGHYILAKKHFVTAERLLTNAFNKNPNELFLGDIIETLIILGKREKALSLVEKLKMLDGSSVLPIILEAKICYEEGDNSAKEVAAIKYIAKNLFSLTNEERMNCVLREFKK